MEKPGIFIDEMSACTLLSQIEQELSALRAKTVQDLEQKVPPTLEHYLTKQDNQVFAFDQHGFASSTRNPGF